MIQSRLENEQFSSLPNLILTERSRIGLITTDRPDSSQLVDLHVYIIPKSVWKDNQHLALNDAMEDAISAGFVRVSPSMKLHDLRGSIEQLCGNENYFPRDFIYLRSVGRCMTRVKPRQENELKVKHYRPPQTFAPEIYLLEGRHEDYAHIPCASPVPSTASYVFGNRHQQRFNLDDGGQSPTRLHQNYHRRPMRGGKHYPPASNSHESLPQIPSSSRQSWAKYTQTGSDGEDASTSVSVATSIVTRDFSKLREEQERLRRRQAELERMRRAAEQKKAQAEREEEEERRRRQEQAEAERRRRLEQERAEAERRRREQEEAAATRIQATYRGFKDRQTFKERKRKLDHVKEVEEEKEEPNKNPSPYPNLRRRSLLIPTPIENRHETQPLSTPQSTISNYSNKEHEDTQNEISPIPSRASSIATVSYQDSSTISQIEKPLIIKRERTESFSSTSSSNISSLLSVKNLRTMDQLNILPHSKTHETMDTAPFSIDTEPFLRSDSPIHEQIPEKKSNENEDKTSHKFTIIQRQSSPEYLPETTPEPVLTATPESLPRTTPETLPSTTPEVKPQGKVLTDQIELERREAEARRRRQLEEEEQKRKAKELEEQRRKELAKRQREDPETLRARLQELRARRAELEKIREEVIRHLKNIHNRITLRRKEARDMWKKKYFHEKKKTPPLEERIILLKNELDQIHKKTIQTIDGEIKYATQMGHTKEADTGNFIVHLTRTHHDIQDVRHQVEQAKLRLTTDVKLRNQAENECRSLRHELNQAKMNLNHIKTRVGA